ncbi:MAG: TIGR04255 family protein [Methanobacterium sp.]
MGNRYTSNFLTNVIVRVDFPNKLPVEERLPPEVTKIILKSFPISEPKKILGKEFKIKSEESIEVETNELKRTEWSFFGKNREKTLVVAPEALYISYKEYSSFEALKSEFMGVVKKIFDNIKDVQVNRIGLRYINEIGLNEPNPTDWTLYLDERLLSIFDLCEDMSKVARGFSNLILNYGDMMLSFNYGMHNPDMPAPIKKKVFILDYDAYYQGFLEVGELEENLVNFHNEIEKMFENNIKDHLRTIMNEQGN